MKNFISLQDGTLLNINAIAYIEIANLPDETGGGIIPHLRVTLFPFAESDRGPQWLSQPLKATVAAEFLKTLQEAGVDVSALKEGMKPMDPKLKEAIKKAVGSLPKKKSGMVKVSGL